MKNFENNLDVIVDVIYNNMAVDAETNRLKLCQYLSCSKCLFYHNEKCNCDSVTFKKWLNAEYKEPSKKIKLTEFEYDLLDSNDQSHQRIIGSFQTYENMRQRGYFENVPFDKSIEYVLENCEVIDR